MNKKLLNNFILSIALLSFGVQGAYSIEQPQDFNTATVQKTEYGKVQYSAKEFKKNIDSISNKFANINIQSAYDDMMRMILDNEGNDYYLMLLYFVDFYLH